MQSLAIVSPSFIDSPQRLEFAVTSQQSLSKAVGDTYPHYIVADVPKSSNPSRANAEDDFYQHRSLYAGNPYHVHERKGRGSASALLKAVEMARSDGHGLCYIHLDDLVYRPEIAYLLKWAQDAFEQDSELQVVKLGGHPLLHQDCDPVLGNRTFLKKRFGRVVFQHLRLRPTRETDYTLWWTRLKPSTVKRDFWPVSMWMAVYRTGLLQHILASASKLHLADVERYYKRKKEWKLLAKDFPGRLGFINMQSAGIDLHHCPNWKECLEYPNFQFR